MKLLPIKLLGQRVKKTSPLLNNKKIPFINIKKSAKKLQEINKEKIITPKTDEIAEEEMTPIVSKDYEWLLHKAVQDIFIKK